jgi:isoquinoline 1-oxidoreductase beta subunit
MKNTHVPVGPWRGVNTNQNGIFMEVFMDECAKAAGKDPLAFRQAIMKDYPKHLGVLNAAGQKSKLGQAIASRSSPGYCPIHGIR